jgi:DNA-binding MarR family transcriptional regulator
LERFSEPKPTPSMTPAKPKKAKKKATKKTGLTDAQKETARDKFTSGDMDIKELAKELKVTQTILKPFLKSLNA